MNVDLFGNAIIDDIQPDVKVKKKNPFDFINNIAKKVEPEDYEDYNPFLTNLSFSQRQDLVIYANEMNKYHSLDNHSQFDFYYYGLPKKNLFSKWSKKSEHDYIDSVKEYYNVPESVALNYLKVLTVEQKEYIQSHIGSRKGGKE